MGCCVSSVDVAPEQYTQAELKAMTSIDKMTHDEFRKTYTAIADDFGVGEVLGKGSFGEVRVCTELSSQTEYAIKIISKVKFWKKEDRRYMKTESFLMEKASGHPNVVNLKESREDRMHYYLIMEHCKGKELMDKLIERKGSFSEQVAARYFRQMCAAVRHCHENKVMHRDLKPENFIFEDVEENSNLKLTDFGLSAYLPTKNAVLSEVVGSSYYIAPEMFTFKYTKMADVWSLGIILYLLLSGTVPFGANVETEPEIHTSIRRDRLKFKSRHWKGVSSAAIELIKRILNKNPQERPGLDEILEDRWVKGEAAKTTVFNKKIVESMYHFNNRNKFRKQALKWIASTLQTEDVEQLREAFYSIDKNKTGVITFEELSKSIAKLGLDETIDVRQLMRQLDTDGDGHISYEEFLTATAERQLINHQNHVWWAFCQYDRDGDGYITADELKEALDEESAERIDEYIQEFDRNGDGVIDYEEFMRMVLPRDLKVKVKEN